MSASFNGLPESLLAQAAAQGEVPLVSLLGLDLEKRWHAGQRLTIEDYLHRIPSLNERPELLLELLYAEWVLREQFGPKPTLEEYRGRFPALADSLGRLLWLHAALSQNERQTLPPIPPAAPPAEQETVPPPATPEPATLPQASFASQPAGSGTTTAASAPGVHVPGYEVLAELGRGGMGVVYKARHLQLNRMVALKMVLAGGHTGSEERIRFLAEAEAVAALQHSNIVQVFDFGQHDGLPYMALEYVNGGSLAGRLGDGLPQPREAAWLVEQLRAAWRRLMPRGSSTAI